MPAVRLPGSNDMRALTVLSVSLLPVPWIRMALLVMTRPSMSCKLRECLKTNVKDLSDPCKEVLVKAVNVKACAADVKQHCGDIKAGEGRVEACMKAHVADVSDACKVALANAAAGED